MLSKFNRNMPCNTQKNTSSNCIPVQVQPSFVSSCRASISPVTNLRNTSCSVCPDKSCLSCTIAPSFACFPCSPCGPYIPCVIKCYPYTPSRICCMTTCPPSTMSVYRC